MAAIACEKLGKWHTPSTRLPGSGDSASSIDVENASVPSEPTSRCERLCTASPAASRVTLLTAKSASLHAPSGSARGASPGGTSASRL